MRKRTIDALFVQAGIAAALSFSHIHDVAQACGQGTWQAWAYPISVDLLLFAAWRRLRKGEGGRQEWVWFCVALVASLGANLATAGLMTGQPPQWLALVVAGWPAVAFLGGTLLVHKRTRPDSTADTADTQADTPGQVTALPYVPADMAPALADMYEDLADLVAKTPDIVAEEEAAMAGQAATDADTSQVGGVDEDTHAPTKPVKGPDMAELRMAAVAIQEAGQAVNGTSLAGHFGVSGRTGRRYADRLKADMATV